MREAVSAHCCGPRIEQSRGTMPKTAAKSSGTQRCMTVRGTSFGKGEGFEGTALTAAIALIGWPADRWWAEVARVKPLR